MSDPKPAASLTAGLLARKGDARPAMRPQRYDGNGDLDDLGWNDMGSEVGLAPMPEGTNERIVLKSASESHVAPVASPALEQQAAIASVFAKPVPQARDESHKAKAAFTLRLDPDRHLKLRLVSAQTRRSAQSLLIEALDQFLTAFGAPVEKN